MSYRITDDQDGEGTISSMVIGPQAAARCWTSQRAYDGELDHGDTLVVKVTDHAGVVTTWECEVAVVRKVTVSARTVES